MIDKFLEQLKAFAGEEDKEWNRAPGTPLLHQGYKQHAASIELEMGEKLFELVGQHRPTTIVEVGTCIGYSTTWLLLAALEYKLGTVTTFDIEEWPIRVWKEIKGLPLDKLKFVKKASWDAGSDLPEQIDFVFHDASHDVEPTQRELEILAPRITKNGCMAFHDVNLCRHMGDVVKKYFADRVHDWDYSEWAHGRGLGIAIRK